MSRYLLAVAGLLATQLVTPQPNSIAIVGGQVLDGTRAAPIADGVVLIAGDRITAVGAAGSLAIPAGSKIIRADGMTVMPGLIDMHVHLALIGSMNGGRFVREHLDRQEKEILPGRHAAISSQWRDHRARHRRSDRDHQKCAIELTGANWSGRGSFVSGPLLQGWGWEVSGVEDSRDKVRQPVAAGVDWIKIHDHQDFSEEEAAAIAQEAARTHKPSADHGYQNDAEVMLALKYRFPTLEHFGLGRSYDYSKDTMRAVIGADACLDPMIAVRLTFFETEKFPARRNDLIASEALRPTCTNS